MSIQGSAKFAWDVLVIAALLAAYVVGLTVQTAVAHLARIPRAVRPVLTGGQGEPADRR